MCRSLTLGAMLFSAALGCLPLASCDHKPAASAGPGTEETPGQAVRSQHTDRGSRLQFTRPGATPAESDGPPPARGGAVPFLVAPDGRVAAIDKQEVPSQRDGQLLFIGTEATPEEEKTLPQANLFRTTVGFLVTPLKE